MSNNSNKKFYQAVAVMIGYVIGVGMFGMPYLMANSGVLSFLFFLILLVPVQYTIHLMHAAMILATKEYHRMPGYAGIYLGKEMKWVLFVAKVIGNWGGLLAYIIISGIFLHTLLSPVFGGTVFVYSSSVFFVEALIVYFGVSMIARAELFMSFLLILVVGLISFKGLNYLDYENLSLVGKASFFLPYGAMLMALDGNGSLAIVARLVKRDPKMMRKVIQLSTLIVAIVLIVFTFSIVGISGAQTSEDALSGLADQMNGILFFSLIFGVICMFTSFMGVSQSIKETFSWDYGLGEKKSWVLAVFVPYFLYLLGYSDLIEVISFVGAVAGGISAIVTILIFKKIKHKEIVKRTIRLRPNKLVESLLMLMFLIGVVYSLSEYI